MANESEKWEKIGSSTTSPVENPTIKEVLHESVYGLTIGFEVNHPEAFVDDVQNLDIDYGHAFFYLTKDGIVENFFSFGPDGGPKKESKGAAGKRPGTPDYLVREPIKIFRLKINEVQFNEINKRTDKIRKEIEKGEQKYYVYVNDTCAETARDIIKGTIESIPNGSGKIKRGRLTTPFSLVNPYMWHKNLSKKYKVFAKESISDFNKILIKGDKDPSLGIPFEEMK